MQHKMILSGIVCVFLAVPSVSADDKIEKTETAARRAMARATRFLRSISTAGGYVGRYSLDLKQRFGEARYEKAGKTEIWVQPPGTPSVGKVFLRAYRVTGEKTYRDAAREVGRALAWGQRKEGGWGHRVDVGHLTPEAKMPERKSGHCTFDDNISQEATSFLMELDGELDEPWLIDSVRLALQFFQEAQFDNGAWPQWYPLRGGYHDYYTYNDNAINDCIRVMLEAHRRYGNSDYLETAERGGAFIVASQLDPPQAGWAQQHAHDMQPADARRFEPAGVCSAATARNIRTLVDLYLYTGDGKYLEPIPDAIDWLNRSKLEPDQILESEGGEARNVWARLYEVGTNRPIYGDRASQRKTFYDLRKVSERERTSYGWQGSFGVPGAIRYYHRVKERGREKVLADRKSSPSAERLRRRARSLEPRVRRVISALDEKGRWTSDGMLETGTFVRNLNLLCDYLQAAQAVERSGG